jgi:hypothetical protein
MDDRHHREQMTLVALILVLWIFVVPAFFLVPAFRRVLALEPRAEARRRCEGRAHARVEAVTREPRRSAHIPTA